jgi:hypothetical protein
MSLSADDLLVDGVSFELCPSSGSGSHLSFPRSLFSVGRQLVRSGSGGLLQRLPPLVFCGACLPWFLLCSVLLVSRVVLVLRFSLSGAKCGLGVVVGFSSGVVFPGRFVLFCWQACPHV